MTHDPAALSIGLAARRIDPADITAHLVVKRGHRGRYRMTFIVNGVRMTGDLTVEGVEQADRTRDLDALAIFKQAAATLVASIPLACVKP